MLGREEAEGETRRLREENRLLRQDVEEGRARERRVGERMEGVMVGLATLNLRVRLIGIVGGAATNERESCTFSRHI